MLRRLKNRILKRKTVINFKKIKRGAGVWLVPFLLALPKQN
jgi:hypothetical protein